MVLFLNFEFATVGSMPPDIVIVSFTILAVGSIVCSLFYAPRHGPAKVKSCVPFCPVKLLTCSYK